MKNQELELLIEKINDEQIANSELIESLAKLSVQDIASVIEGIDDPKKELLVIRLLKKDLAAEVFAYLDYDTQEEMLGSLSNAETAYLIDELYADDAADILDEMPPQIVKKVLSNADSEKRRTINELLNYGESTAGSIMTTEFVSFEKSITVREAFEHIRKDGIDKETIYTCYVTDKSKLIGVVTAKDMILSDIENTVDSIMIKEVISVRTSDDREFVADQFKKYDFIAMPVIDNDGMLVGIITVDDILDVIHYEHTEDIQMQAAILPSEKPYLKTSAWFQAKKRIFWLVILLAMGFVSGAVMQGFEKVLTAVTILASSIPMLMGTGGNSGSQASTLVIRSMVLGDIDERDALRVVFREMLVALICGLLLAPICFVKVLLIDSKFYLGNPINMQTVLTGITVSIALVLTIVIAKSIGSFLPILAKKLKLDPAVMAAPLITTIVDISALVIYFSLASWLLL